MRHYILYYHGGSSNHGCEALVRTTSELLDNKKNKISLLSFRPDDDKKYGIDQFCDIHMIYEKKSVSRWKSKWWKAYLQLKVKNNYFPIEDLLLLNAVGAQKGDIAISIGGDNYCYNDTNGLVCANELWRRNSIKTVLWGCSIEPIILDDPVIAEDISRFDLITARESISYQALIKVNPNTVLVSDSAFWLKTQKTTLPTDFSKNGMVGINLSPLAEKLETTQGLTLKNYETLIEFILNKSKMNILLIPHVIIEYNDDRVINNYLFEKYKDTGRIRKIEDCSCEKLKGYISQCRFFVGARTHATIAAYSHCIPTLVLGYSVKSLGIAKDLFGSAEHYVLPVQHLKTKNDLKESFKWIIRQEDSIRDQLNRIMPEYKNRVYVGINEVKKL